MHRNRSSDAGIPRPPKVSHPGPCCATLERGPTFHPRHGRGVTSEDGRPPKWTGFDFVGPIAELISCDTTTEAVKRAAAPAMPKRQNGPKKRATTHGGDDVSRAHAHIHRAKRRPRARKADHRTVSVRAATTKKRAPRPIFVLHRAIVTVHNPTRISKRLVL